MNGFSRAFYRTLAAIAQGIAGRKTDAAERWNERARRWREKAGEIVTSPQQKDARP